MKKIIVGVIAFIVIALIVSNKITFVPYEGPVKSYNQKLGKYEITTKSVIQIVPSGRLEDYCNYINREYYEDPQIIIKDTVTNSKETYKLTSKNGYTRIVMGGGSTNEKQEVSNIFVHVSEIGKECSFNHWTGNIVINNKGKLFPLTPPVKNARKDTVIIDNKNNEMILTLINGESQVWTSDYNADTNTDLFITEQNPSNPNERIVYMWDVTSNTFSSWFNNGQPVVTNRTIEEINNDWTTNRVFINTHSKK